MEVGRALQASSPTTRLLHTLVALFGAIILGYVAVRMQLVVPGNGDLRGAGFFVGKVAFPLLVFRMVATTSLGTTDPGTIIACTLGKAVVFVATFLFTFFAYQAKRSTGQRILSATIFAFFTVASNDFAVAFPVVNALYDPSITMGIYIAANALVGVVLFMPITMVLLAIGENMLDVEDDSEAAEEEQAQEAQHGVSDGLPPEDRAPKGDELLPPTRAPAEKAIQDTRDVLEVEGVRELLQVVVLSRSRSRGKREASVMTDSLDKRAAGFCCGRNVGCGYSDVELVEVDFEASARLPQDSQPKRRSMAEQLRVHQEAARARSRDEAPAPKGVRVVEAPEKEESESGILPFGICRGEGNFDISETSQPCGETGEAPSGLKEDCCSKLQSVLKIAWGILTNPIIVWTLISIAFRLLFGWTLQKDGSLPSPLFEIIGLFVGPFGMMALFLTGTALRSAKLAFWPIGLVVMKVIVCAYVSAMFGQVLAGGENSELLQVHRDFTLFYGCIPSSSSPLIFAQQYDPASAEIMATSVLFGMVLGGPVMFTMAVFLDPKAASRDMAGTIQSVQINVGYLSLAAGFIYFALFLLLGKEFCQQCSSKRLLVITGFTLLITQILMLLMTPSVVGNGPCLSYLENPWSIWGLAVCFFQNSARLMKLLLFFCMVFLWPAGNQQQPPPPPGSPPPRVGPWGIAFIAAGICFVLAIIPTVLVSPSTVNELCAGVMPSVGLRGETLQRVADLVWSVVLLLIVSLISVKGILSSGGEKETADGQAPEQGQQTRVSCSACEVPQDVDSECGSEPPVPVMNWACALPSMQVKVLNSVLGLKVLIQVVNEVKSLASDGNGSQVTGGFAQMLALENLLEHGSVLIFLGALFTDDHFALHISNSLTSLWPLLFQPNEDLPPPAGLDMADLEPVARVTTGGKRKSMARYSMAVQARASRRSMAVVDPGPSRRSIAEAANRSL